VTTIKKRLRGRLRSKKLSNICGGKTIHTFLGVLHIFLPGDSKVHFDFAVYEVSKLGHTMNSLCYCAARLSALAKVCQSRSAKFV